MKSVVPDGLYFYYGLLWSNDRTWGLDPKPVSGDLVWVPKGRTLIIDESSPIFIESVVNEGRVIFADIKGKNIEFHVKYFVNTRSELIMGTNFRSYKSNLTINLYGTSKDI